MTGAARGQGPSRALAGADVAVNEICGPVKSVQYQLGTLKELQEVARQAPKLGAGSLARAATSAIPIR